MAQEISLSNVPAPQSAPLCAAVAGEQQHTVAALAEQKRDDPTAQLQAQITETWAQIAAESGRADYEDHPLFEAVTDLEAELASTPPQSVPGLIVLLRQALEDSVLFREGTASYETAIEHRPHRAVLTAIETLELWQKGAARQAPDALTGEQG